MDRSVLLTTLAVGLAGALLAPLFGPTAAYSPVVAFLVCTLGALAGLWIVSYALALDAR